MSRWHIRKFIRSLDNWWRGFAFGYVRRCRVCGHTAYTPDHCAALDGTAKEETL